MCACVSVGFSVCIKIAYFNLPLLASLSLLHEHLFQLISAYTSTPSTFSISHSHFRFILDFINIVVKITDKKLGKTEKILRIPIFARVDKDVEMVSKKKGSNSKDGESDWDKDIRNMPSMERLVNEKKVALVFFISLFVCLFIQKAIPSLLSLIFSLCERII